VFHAIARGTTRHDIDQGGDEMPKKGTGSSIKKPDTYEALKDKGMSKERAAKISNAQANKKKRGKK
jgi:hypothetical protein